MAVVRPSIASFVAVVALGVACQSLVGIEDSPPAPGAGAGGDASLGGNAGSGGQSGSGGTAGVAGSSGSGGAAGTGGAPDAGCDSVRPPTATPGADSGGNLELVVAIRQIQMGDGEIAGGPAWPHLGFDLDKLCTCSTDTLGSCKAPKKVVCDGLSGRDNALGSFLYQVRTVFKVGDLSSEKLSAKFEAGGNTVMIRVRGYNGTPDDGQVEVAWIASDDFEATNSAPPKWDGTDEWPVLSSSLEAIDDGDGGKTYDLEHTKYVDKLGYVANGTLVASLPQGSFSLTAATTINFTAGLFTAKLESVTGGGWALKDGVLAGITKVGDVLGILPSVDDPFSGNPICTDNILYVGIKSMICDYPDMTILGTQASACDYLSLGVSFSGDPAKLGTIVDKPPVPNKCPSGTNPANDSC